MQVQDYLSDKINSGFSVTAALKSLTDEFGISAKIYPDDDMVLLDYSQIDSPKSHPIVIECRSLILRVSDLSIVSRKFDRFFNANECPEHYTDFVLSRAKVLEKSDGSLIGMYHNGVTNRWEISTRGMAKAEGGHAFGGTFREKVLDAMGVTEEQFQEKFDANLIKGCTYIAEFCSPENRVVTKYSTPHMVLLGVVYAYGYQYDMRDLGNWVLIMQGFGINIRPLQQYDLKATLAELIEDANALTDLKEGFVVWDEVSGKRMKIKSATYLIAHKLRGNDAIPTRKNLLILVLEGEVEEFLVYFPEWQSAIEEIQAEVKLFEKQLIQLHNQHCNISDQKEFALSVKDFHGSGYLFTARKTNQLPITVFHSANINQKLRTFGV